MFALDKSTVRVLSTAAVFAAVMWCLWIARPILLLLISAGLIAAALSPAVTLLTTKAKLPRGLAVGVCLIVLLAGFVGMIAVVAPPMASGINATASDVPHYLDTLEQSSAYRKLDQQYDISRQLQDSASLLPSKAGNIVGVVQSATFGFLGGLVSVVTTIALAAYLLLDGPKMIAFLVRNLPEEEGLRVIRLTGGVRKAVSGYLFAVAALGIVAAFVAYIVLTILGVKAALPLAGLMAVGSLVPMIGAPVAAVIIAIFAALTSIKALIVWLIVFVTYQQLENHILQPMIYKKTVELHPLVVIPAIMVGTAQLGIIGALLAVPIAACVQVAVKDWWHHRYLRPDNAQEHLPLDDLETIDEILSPAEKADPATL